MGTALMLLLKAITKFQLAYLMSEHEAPFFFSWSELGKNNFVYCSDILRGPQTDHLGDQIFITHL